MPADDPAPLEPHGGDGRWRIELLGGLKARSGDWVVPRFPSRPVASLLARLALAPRRSHAREELIELLWPGVTVEVGRNRLRQALSTLRTLLEPNGGAATPVLLADRQTVRLNAEAVDCDVLQFERAFREQRDADARSLYQGELLPGITDEWVVDERVRLAALYDELETRQASPAATSSLASSFATPQTWSAPRLPSYLSNFFGRDTELVRCREALATQRLMTISGPGGSGKTRLAIEAVRRLTGFEPIVFVALADCDDGARLADRVRAAARLPSGAQAALEALSARFSERRALLVLDNFEQLVGHGGGEALLELLTALPHAHALVTSRRVLHLAGEVELPLAPLSLPGVDDDLDEVARNPSVALFIDRARNVRPEFRLTARNRVDLLTVCRMLEGLPLALEIAATRVRTYSLAEMRTGLTQRFRMLIRSSPRAARDPRHASLHAAIDWSWRLLDPRMQSFLRDLTVFRGGWTADDAAAVTAVEDAHAWLDSLVADSLLAVAGDFTEAAVPARFHMLEALREFVMERLDPPDLAMRRAHRVHCLHCAKALAGRRQAVAEEAVPNMVEALRSALDDGEHELALSLAFALRPHWQSVGTPPEALALMRRAARSVAPDTVGMSCFLSMLAILLLMAGESAEALDCATSALAVAGDDPMACAEARFSHTRVAWIWKHDAAEVIGPAREGLHLARVAGGEDIVASALGLLGAITLWGLNEPEQALPIYAEAEALHRRIGHSRGALQGAHGAMGCLYVAGRYEQASAMGHRLVREAEALGHVEGHILSLNLLTACQLRLRRFADALANSRLQTRLADRHHRVYNMADALWSQGYCLARLRRPAEAASMMAFSERYWLAHRGPLPADETRDLRRVRRLVDVQIGAEARLAAWSRGLQLSEREGIRLGSATDSELATGSAPGREPVRPR